MFLDRVFDGSSLTIETILVHVACGADVPGGGMLTLTSGYRCGGHQNVTKPIESGWTVVQQPLWFHEKFVRERTIQSLSPNVFWG